MMMEPVVTRDRPDLFLPDPEPRTVRYTVISVDDHHRSGYGQDWPGELRPAEVLKRNFWFCTLDDPSTIDTRHRIGVEHIMLEADYPHGESTWPDTQDVVQQYWGHIPDDELRLMTHVNAARLYQHPLPDKCLP
jgi:hypothetical protein